MVGYLSQCRLQKTVPPRASWLRIIPCVRTLMLAMTFGRNPFIFHKGSVVRIFRFRWIKWSQKNVIRRRFAQKEMKSEAAIVKPQRDRFHDLTKFTMTPTWQSKSRLKIYAPQGGTRWTQFDFKSFLQSLYIFNTGSLLPHPPTHTWLNSDELL